MARNNKSALRRLRSFLGWLFLAPGILALVMVLLAFTSIPFWTWYHMSVKEAGIRRPPDCIVVLGGGGMPSETGLMRTWYGARAALRFPRASVIVALPGDPGDSLSSLSLMKKELILRGVAPERILLEDSGTNTRAQAVNILSLVTRPQSRVTRRPSPVTRHASLLIVTSPEHLYRAVLAFRKAGFLRVDGLPAFEQAIESDITFRAGRLGGRSYVPDIGQNLTLRYRFWTQIDYEMLLLREYAALAYYKMKGWI